MKIYINGTAAALEVANDNLAQVKPLTALNAHKGELVKPEGYTYVNYEGEMAVVFGKVTKGMDAVMKIVKVPTGNAGPHQNVPLTPIVIEEVVLVTASAAPAAKDASAPSAKK